MSRDLLPLPTVISGAAILNAVVRGAETATKKLGHDYFTVVHKDFMNVMLTVHRVEAQIVDDVLAPTQAPVTPEATLWSMKLTEREMLETAMFKTTSPKYFFLSRDEALSYIASIEAAVVDLVLKAANKTTNKES